MTDDAAGNGIYKVAITPTTAGDYYLNIKHSDLHFDDSPYEITVSTDSSTSAAHSNFTGINADKAYKTGEYL